MKKTIAIAFFILLSLKHYAQIEKGTYVPSISINGTYSKKPTSDSISSAKNNTYNITTNLGFGRFIKDNLLLAGTFSYGHSGGKQTDVNNISSLRNSGSSNFGNTESVGISLLKYTFLTENFAIRYGGSFSVNYSEDITRHYNDGIQIYNPLTGVYNNGYQTSSYTNNLGINLNLLAGIQYFVSKNLALTGNMGFFSVNDTYSPYGKSKHIDAHTLNFSLTPSFNAFSVGLTYYFRPKASTAK